MLSSMLEFVRAAKPGRQGRPARRGSARRYLLRGEALETRRLLAADAALVGFEAVGNQLAIQWTSGTPSAAVPRLAIYSSPDGTTPGRLLHSELLENQPSADQDGLREAAIDANFALSAEETLLARLEDPLVEQNHGAPQLALEGGVFQDGQGVVHVVGSQQADLISLYEFGVVGVSMNGVLYTFDTGKVTGFMVHGLDQNDLVAGPGLALLSPSREQGYESGERSIDREGAEGEYTPPQIQNFTCFEHHPNMWLFRGKVVDDGPLSGIRVHITFWGSDPMSMAETYGVTDAQGNFSIALYIQPGAYGLADAYATDRDALISMTQSCYVDNGDPV